MYLFLTAQIQLPGDTARHTYRFKVSDCTHAILIYKDGAYRPSKHLTPYQRRLLLRKAGELHRKRAKAAKKYRVPIA